MNKRFTYPKNDPTHRRTRFAALCLTSHTPIIDDREAISIS